MGSGSSMNTTETILSQLETLVTAAQQGTAEALPHIQRLLDDYPQLWQHFGDLTKHTEAKWLKLVSGNNAVVHESLQRTLTEQREELLLDGDSEMERLLVDRIIVSQLMTRFFDAALALAVDAPESRVRYLEQRLDRAEKRHSVAVKALAETRKLLAHT